MSDAIEQPSKLLLDECFAAEDERFLDEFFRFHNRDFLLSFTQRWLTDTRPWARQQITAYISRDLNLPGHEVVVKRLFKHFEANDDDEILASFLVAFDRLVRRRRVRRVHYNWRSREVWTEEHLRAIPDRTIVDGQSGRRPAVNPRTGMSVSHDHYTRRNQHTNRLFSHRTRNHLRRRVWRYFRRLSHTKPIRYLSSISLALSQYADDDFELGENIIDNWALMHACYFHHPAVTFGAAHTNLTAGHSLSELTPAPYQPDAWQREEAVECLINLIVGANSSLIRIWAMELLQTEHQSAIVRLNIGLLIRMLSYSDHRVRQFAADLFASHTQLSNLPLSTWLELIEQADSSVLHLICNAMQTHVSAERLDNDQLLTLACARPVPVARTGFDMLTERHSQQQYTPAELATLATAKCESLAPEITDWTLRTLDASDFDNVDVIVEFFDSLTRTMREAALTWLEEDCCPAADNPVLWARLIETPFDDVRIRLVDNLEQRRKLPGIRSDSIQSIWKSVILAVHRGGRSKIKAVHQISSAIAADDADAEQLLPVLAVAVRSVRKPEQRNALAAIAHLLNERPDLASVN